MIPLAAFGLATAFGSGLAPIKQALAEGNEPLYRRKDVIGSDYQGQLCAFAPNAGLAGVAIFRSPDWSEERGFAHRCRRHGAPVDPLK
ncbi:hypothetical protein SAMN05877809_103176 [Rhodobacter sp. JA431]|nr:hypothetical protein SAMN05877809_103176 [Rhodobacter sp. JA431]